MRTAADPRGNQLVKISCWQARETNINILSKQKVLQQPMIAGFMYVLCCFLNEVYKKNMYFSKVPR